MGMKQKIKTRSQAIGIATLVALGLLLANFLSSRHFFRIDLTEDHEYTLSADTKKILKNLDDRVLIKLYMNSALPPALTNLQEGILDLLDEYRKTSRNKISIERINPSESVQKEQEAQMLGIPPLTLNVVAHDKQEVIQVYLGIAFFYGDKKEVIPAVTDLKDYEYNLTSSLLKLISKKIPNVGLMVPEANSSNSDYKNVQAFFEKQYHPTLLQFTDTDLGSQNLDALVIIDPENAPSTLSKECDSLLNAGTPVLIFAGRINVDGRLEAHEYKSGLEEWLAAHGVELSPKLVIDPQSHTYAAFSDGLLQYRVPYPFFVKISQESLNPNHPATARLENLVFPWTNSLILHSDQHAEWKYETLIKTSDQALLQEGEPDVAIESLDHLDKSKMGKRVLAAQVTASSVDAGKPLTHLMVVANNQFIKDNFLNDFDSNILLPLNLIDSVTWGNDLIGIRSRGQTDRPLAIPSAHTIALIKFGHMLGIPLLVILGGLLFNWRRQRPK